MKILIQMGDSYPDESPCAKRMRCFYDTFTSNGHEVIVMAPRTNKTVYYSGEEDREGNKGVIYCATVRLKKKNVIYRLLNSVVFAFSSIFASTKVGDIDIVITTCPPPLINFSGWIISKMKHAKLVYDVRDIWPDVAWEMGSFSKKSFYSKVFEMIRNFMLKKADLITAVSPGKVKKLKGYSPHKNIVEITNGIDEEFLENNEDMTVVNTYKLDERFTVCYIGNLGLAQGLKQLLYVAKEAQNRSLDVQFLLFGSGAEEKYLKHLADQYCLNNVFFPGRIPNKKVYTVLKHSKMCFVSLVNENLKDSIPTKIFEALGVGCPILLAASGDSARIVEESGLGRIVKPNDNIELWNAFIELYCNIDSYMNKREVAIDYVVGNFSRQKAAVKLENELVRLLHI